MKKITLATVKSFIKKNDEIWINVKSSFSGMTDCIERVNNGFVKATRTDEHPDHHQGIKGAWFVGSSRDHFTAYSDPLFLGYEVSNCCGSFILAVKNKEL